MTEPLSPWETLRSVVSSLSLSDAVWILITIACVFGFYRLAINRRRSGEISWRAVLFWVIALLGWIFALYMVAWRKISTGGFPAFLVLVCSAVAVTITVVVLTRRTKIWERVVSGAVIAIIGFGILATFGRGNQAWGYSLVMGLTLGTFLGMLVSTRRGMQTSMREATEDVDQRSGREQREDKRRKVTEI